MNLARITVAALCITLFAPTSAHAFGKKRTPSPSEPADSQAYPTRVVSFGQFLSTPFMLPDGKTKVDMAVILPDLVLTQMQQSQTHLRASGTSGDGGENKPHFILKGGVTAFEANDMSGGITIGYKPGVGDIGNGTLTGIEGSVKFTIGQLDMDFHIVDTQRNEVVAVGHGSALTGGADISVDIDFGAIKIGRDFVFNTAMAPHFQKAARDAILQMAGDPHTNFLMDWQAQVTSINMNLKQIFFNSGARDDIAVGNIFTVYDNNDMRLGEVKVRSVDHDSSSAAFKSDTGDNLLKSTRAGDAVKIFFKSVP